MPETQTPNTQVPWANPYDLVGAQTPVPPVVPPVQAVPPVQVPVPPAQPAKPAKKPGESFIDKLMRTIAKLMWKPDPFTGTAQPSAAPAPIQQPIPQVQIPTQSVPPVTPEAKPKKGWFMAGVFGSLGDLAKTAGDLAWQAAQQAKKASKDAVKDMNVGVPGVQQPPQQPAAPEAPQK